MCYVLQIPFLRPPRPFRLFVDADGAMFTLLNSSSDPADAGVAPEER